MIERSVATVFGGSGFIGRYVVKRLAAAGHIVRVAGRDPEGAMFLRPMGRVGQVVPLYAPITQSADVARAVAGADIVINLVGILAERRPGDFNRIHAEAAGALAAAAAAAGVKHFIQLSAIGADSESPALYGRSKAAGERAVLAAFPTAVILRPSIVFGPEDKFFNQFAAIAQISPIMPVISGDTKMQPVYVGDVADAVMAALAPPAFSSGAFAGRIFELGGADILTFREILHLVLGETHRHHRLMLEIPPFVARLQAAVLQRLPGRLLTQDQLLMLTRDNVVAGPSGLAALGLVPTPIAPIVSAYLRRYRPGGGRKELVPAP